MLYMRRVCVQLTIDANAAVGRAYHTYERKPSPMTDVSPFAQQDNVILDRIFESRRLVRSFKQDIPPKEDVMRIIRAGLHALRAAEAVAGQNFRRFFVFQGASPQRAHVAALAKRVRSAWLNSCATNWRLIHPWKTKPMGCKKIAATRKD